MPKRVTSPKRKTKMASKSRIPKGSKEAKEWNLKMQEAKRRKKELRERSKRLRSPSRKKGILKKDKSKKPSPKRVKFSKKLENFPMSPGTIDPDSIARK